MVEATTALSLATIAFKLIHSGHKGYLDPDWNTDDTKALSDLTKAIKDMNGINRRIKDDELDPTVQLIGLQTLMICKAFKSALNEHLSIGHQARDRKKAIEDYLEAQLKALGRTSKYGYTSNQELINALDRPTMSKVYLSLWEVMSNVEQSPLGADLMIARDEDGVVGKGKASFEEAFYKYYTKQLDGQLGKKLKELADIPKDLQKRFYRNVLLQRAANFPNEPIVPGDDSSPVLGSMYVEPFVGLDLSKKLASKWMSISFDLCEAVRVLEWVSSMEQVTLVTADFGYGKSLTSRMFAALLAHQALESAAPTGNHPIPIRIVCQNHMSSGHLSYELVERAFKDACIELIRPITKLNDNSELLPAIGEASYHIIIDGLDEIVIEDRACIAFFEELDRKTSEHLSFTVFSRPGVIPSKVSKMIAQDKLNGVRIAQFGVDQTKIWLSNWNKAYRADDPIDEQQFLGVLDKDLQHIPIMLFITATVWDELDTNNRSNLSKAALYDHFVRAMAKGKANDQVVQHEVVQNASYHLLGALSSRFLKERADSTEAMLWFMGRLAWKRFALSSSRQLALRDVKGILQDELGISQDLNIVEQGACLAAQIDFSRDDHRIFFQHESFAEFFVARFWIHSLQYLARIDADPSHREDKKRLLAILMEVDFNSVSQATLDFFFQYVQHVEWDDQFVDWCKQYIETKNLSPERTSIFGDKVLNFKIVLYQLIVSLGEPMDLRSDIFRHIVATRHDVLWFVDFRIAGDRYRFLSMPHIWFKTGVFEGDFESCNFATAHFLNVRFCNVIFSGCNFYQCEFVGCTFEGVFFSDSNFVNARFTDCVFTGCKFEETNFSKSVFSDTTEIDSSFAYCSFFAANFRNQTSFSARFAEECSFVDALYEESVVFPENFDPVKRHMKPPVKY